ncbi:prostamide/prostaglandin F synthase isoform X2 [Neophocaena asiaeorientalis asiaeorientalis]|uniref:Prostamide/prostaglandin F synthase isoform X2 n=1 Tax=Neophocaena asiaeorientalis asiaeorientalis TaxID=1706337 RepID=A0A341CML7_NEOAA|nr:prostamide/prostaglandin F synthase isoform X2 [Neophocaena asiaeorientalis asiaeorientalis]
MSTVDLARVGACVLKHAVTGESSTWMRASSFTRSWASSGQGCRHPGQPLRGPAAERRAAGGRQRWRQSAATLRPEVSR